MPYVVNSKTNANKLLLVLINEFKVPVALSIGFKRYLHLCSLHN